MEPEQRRAAKQQMLELMEAGVSWQEAAATAGVQTSRATAYRWKQEARTRGEAALQDGRHGHPAKVLPPVLHWLESRCQATSLVASSHLQKELQEQLGVRISISHLNAVRATHGWSNVASQAEKTVGAMVASREHESKAPYHAQLDVAIAPTVFLIQLDTVVRETPNVRVRPRRLLRSW